MEVQCKWESFSLSFWHIPIHQTGMLFLGDIWHVVLALGTILTCYILHTQSLHLRMCPEYYSFLFYMLWHVAYCVWVYHQKQLCSSFHLTGCPTSKELVPALNRSFTYTNQTVVNCLNDLLCTEMIAKWEDGKRDEGRRWKDGEGEEGWKRGKKDEERKRIGRRGW